MSRTVFTAAALTLGLVAAPAAAYAGSPGHDGLDTDLLEARLDDFAELADHSVVVEVRDGDDTWSEAVGDRSLETDAREAKPGDRVRVGSVTKSMTATVLVQLQGEGLLDLDDTIGQHLPGLLPYEQDPTIREVLTHQSGLFDFLPYLYPSLLEGDISDVREGYRNHYEPEELIAIGTQGELLFEPGEGWFYSNVGYMTLGLLIEEVTGETYRDVLEEQIFEPADLDRTYVPRDETSGIRGAHLVPYVTTGDPSDPYFDTTALSNTQMWSGGGVISTVGDLNDFYAALTDGTLLTAEELAEATRYVDTGKSFDYGLGLMNREIECPDGATVEVFGHDGDGLGHETISFHSVDGERRISVAWNIGDKHGYTDSDEFDDALDALMAAGLCGS
ncbi:beta-lactamase family protein [Glycomyces sp. TRM65418]|uniref:serine hydrolase domain-containing protein n=1 Tax=Glycomyces sp. TRM65418 TaxID=2867006 RepID=UPI001CE5F03A|nr:serine hydrolase domain-containing protein [Glycomyces sp. TRM65418]MCC3764071.1 beta-lactamase family protein [Glycomyces sp. TRM65418]QZD53761.1 beta-lactamase family protein [Glycomyces sp. TRM65418]